MTKKINLGATIGALLLFFLPWVDFQCSGKSLLTQSGFQTITGKASLAGEMKQMQEQMGGGEAEQDDNVDMAVFVALALVAVIAAAGFALLGLQSADPSRNNVVAILCGVALALLLLQMMVGFPAERDLKEQMSEQSGTPGDPANEMGAVMGAAMGLSVKYMFALWLELVLLAIPVVLLVNGMIDKNKRPTIPPPPGAPQ